MRVNRKELNFIYCRSGGIGRRARLKIVSRKGWRFDSSLRHKKKCLRFFLGSFLFGFLLEESNRKGVGKTLVFPWRKVWENRGFPRSEIAKRPLSGTNLKADYEHFPRNWGFLFYAKISSCKTMKLLEIQYFLSM